MKKKLRILTPEEFEKLLGCIQDRFRVLLLTEIETGLRWGELIALRPRHIDFLRKTITVEDHHRDPQEDHPDRPADAPQALPEG